LEIEKAVKQRPQKPMKPTLKHWKSKL